MTKTDSAGTASSNPCGDGDLAPRVRIVSVQTSKKSVANSPAKPSAPTGPARMVLAVPDGCRWKRTKRSGRKSAKLYVSSGSTEGPTDPSTPARGRKPVLRDELAAVVAKQQYPRERVLRMNANPRELVRRRLSDERGTFFKEAPERTVLIYPSPYSVAMSSLGFQTIYREINSQPNRAAERSFLPDDPLLYERSGMPLFSYESGRPVNDFPVVAFSVAYEPEIAGVVKALQLARIPLFFDERGASDPFVLFGGPLTFSNPLPLSPFADAILIGEADQTIHQVLDIVFESRDRDEARQNLAREIPSCFIPAIHGEELRPREVCDNSKLPAFSQICTLNTELSDMFLVEGVRGCAHTCAYCVMRRSNKSGMRIVPKETILGIVPDDVRRVGLVGASISEHPHIREIVEALASKGLEVGLSSLRPEQLDLRFVTALKKGGYRTLTTAMDGASQRLRDQMDRRVDNEHLLQAAKLARALHLQRLKLYVMIGLPDESDSDIDELIDFSLELAAIHPVALGISPFVPKRNTPLSTAAFAGITVIENRLQKLRRAVRSQVKLRAVSARWAWVEYMIAQGGPARGRAVVEAVNRGGAFREWKKAFEKLGSGGK
jgi:radical SAM superfamily enzyme YgiQ (UPF0313 family)